VSQDHPKDAELLNKPIQHYEQMEQIFGGGMATIRWAQGSREALGLHSGFVDSGVKVEMVDLSSTKVPLVDLSCTKQ
jgi:hypothetical protein